MTTTNEPKYKIENGKIVNRQSGEAIPDDEPIFILRGRDKHAAATLRHYLNRLDGEAEHGEAVCIRIDQFEAFATDHPDRMKEPDTTLTDDWKQ